jgi:hypothetical protein
MFSSFEELNIKPKATQYNDNPTACHPEAISIIGEGSRLDSIKLIPF